eukprot:jgi/Ulvmu1/807/UM010_0181.1
MVTAVPSQHMPFIQLQCGFRGHSHSLKAVLLLPVHCILTNILPGIIPDPSRCSTSATVKYASACHPSAPKAFPIGAAAVCTRDTSTTIPYTCKLLGRLIGQSLSQASIKAAVFGNTQRNNPR